MTTTTASLGHNNCVTSSAWRWCCRVTNTHSTIAATKQSQVFCTWPSCEIALSSEKARLWDSSSALHLFLVCFSLVFIQRGWWWMSFLEFQPKYVTVSGRTNKGAPTRDDGGWHRIKAKLYCVMRRLNKKEVKFNLPKLCKNPIGYTNSP